jgi:aryl carrier-like protein
LADVESIEGPLIATIPVRVHMDRSSTVESFLQTVQQGVLARAPYQHFGMQNIRKVSREAQHACETGTGLVIAPDTEPEYVVGGELGFGQGDAVSEALHFNPYPLMLSCGIRKGGIRICASFDSSLIDVAQMKRVLAQLETACSQLTSGLSRRVDEISCLPQADVEQIWRWNQTPPLSLDETSKRLRAEASITQGSIYPPAVVPWVCDPRNPSQLLSPIGCVGELWLEGGAFPSGTTVESPAWLLAGSSTIGASGRRGTVQPTGDLVQLREDSRLVFVGRKENVLPIQGRVVDIAELEAQFTKHLPSTIRAAAAVKHSRGTQQQEPEQELLVFIQQQSQPSTEKDCIELVSERHDMTCDDITSTLCSQIPLSLAEALRKLDKFIQDSLPPYMVPSAYVVVDQLPTENEQIDHRVLNLLASEVPREVIGQLQKSFKEAWVKSSAQANLTANEDILRSSWANVLRIDPAQIDLDDNFFRLGGDSVLAMKLVSGLRTQGHVLTVADIFQHMRLRDAAKVLKVGQAAASTQEKAGVPYRPFSTLGGLDESTLVEVVRSKLPDPRWSIQDILPVTDSQALDVGGTVHAPRTSMQYTMLYFQSDNGLVIDRQRLLWACDELVKSHEILRTVFVEHESKLYQVVLDHLKPRVAKYRADKKDLEAYVTDLCKADIEADMPLGSPFFRILHVESQEDGGECLVLGLSHAQYDGVSLPTLLRDLETLYSGGAVNISAPFSSYMARIGDERVQAKALDYWRGLLKGSSLSVLGPKSGDPKDKSIFQTKPLGEDFRRPEEITTASLVTAAWAVVLARRLETRDVTFGSITSGRSHLDPDNVVVGPCYQFTPVRVSFEDRQQTAMDLLRAVQTQSAESAAHDFVGFDQIARQTEWTSGGFFDSVVHHQDFEDFDTMPFAGGSCKVDIWSPHGDAAHPLKVVSFFPTGGDPRMHVGVVGSGNDSPLVTEVLDELAATVQELADGRSEPLSV